MKNLLLVPVGPRTTDVPHSGVSTLISAPRPNQLGHQVLKTIKNDNYLSMTVIFCKLIAQYCYILGMVTAFTSLGSFLGFFIAGLTTRIYINPNGKIVHSTYCNIIKLKLFITVTINYIY